jgi:hypothetical protein
MIRKFLEKLNHPGAAELKLHISTYYLISLIPSSLCATVLFSAVVVLGTLNTAAIDIVAYVTTTPNNFQK